MKKILLSYLLIISLILNAQINLGTGSTNLGVAPISTYYGYSYVQQIFTKQEINANAAGNITGLKFYLNPSKSISNSNSWVVYLGYTSKTSFTSDTDWIPVVQLTQVFAGTVTNNNGVVEVIFPVPFPYNNINNLVIAAEENAPDYDNNDFNEVFYVYDSSPNSTIYYRSDNTNPGPAAPPAGDLADYKSVVTISGLTQNSTPACPNVTFPANNSTFVPLSPTFTWNTVSTATSYKVSVGTTPGGTNIVNQQSVSTNNFTPSLTLTSNTVYYLRVVSVGASGESSGCADIMFKTIPPDPSNDDCTTAITLTVNPDLNCGMVTAGYTLGATSSGLIPDPCYGEPDDDVWFKFTATSTRHKISLNNITSVGSSSDDTDTYFQVFSGNCGNLTSILCSDPESGAVSGLTPGQTYYIRVYSYYDTGSNQSFDICIGTFPPPPSNDICSGALAASAFPYSYIQADGSGATNSSGFATTCSDDMNDGTWFTFAGDGSTLNITVTMPSGSDFDPQIGVYRGSCGNLICENTVDNGGEGTTETISIPTLVGNTYYVNVGEYNDSTDQPEGAFTININNSTLGISEISDAKNNVKLYPNPFNDILNISDVTNLISVSVSDISGRLIKIIDNPKSVLHLGDLKSGMYLVTLIKKDGSKQTFKAIKK